MRSPGYQTSTQLNLCEIAETAYSAAGQVLVRTQQLILLFTLFCFQVSADEYKGKTETRYSYTHLCSSALRISRLNATCKSILSVRVLFSKQLRAGIIPVRFVFRPPIFGDPAYPRGRSLPLCPFRKYISEQVSGSGCPSR